MWMKAVGAVWEDILFLEIQLRTWRKNDAGLRCPFWLWSSALMFDGGALSELESATLISRVGHLI